MKNKIISFSLIFGLLIACKDSKNKIKEEISLSNPSSKISECYLYTVNKDTIQLHLEISHDSIVLGKLLYKIYQKDDNKGNIKGHFKNNILIADYNFLSEGSISIRQLAFKKSGTTLVEGYGEIKEEDNKQSFKDPDNIRFDQGLILNRVDCPNNPSF